MIEAIVDLLIYAALLGWGLFLTWHIVSLRDEVRNIGDRIELERLRSAMRERQRTDDGK